MIARKEAQRLLEEFLEMLYAAEEEHGEELDADALKLLMRKQLSESDLVLRGAENVEQKGRRYLTEGRITVTEAGNGSLIIAHARSTNGEYALGHDPIKNQWRCTCGPSGRKGHCSHLVALKLITSPTTTGGT